MVPDKVTGGEDLASELGAVANEVADEEECGADVVLGEQIEKLRRVRVVGAVVEGEGKLSGVGAGDEGCAEDLGFGRDRSVGTSSGSEAGGGDGCGEGGEHV